MFAPLCPISSSDDTNIIELEKQIPNTDIKVPFVYDSSRKDADFYDFNFQVEPHSMSSQTPGEKMQALRELVNTFIAPLPAMQQQGISIDGREIIRLASELSQLPELKDIFVGDPQQQQQAGMEQPMNKQTEIVRTNRPGATTRGQDDAIARMMASDCTGRAAIRRQRLLKGR